MQRFFSKVVIALTWLLLFSMQRVGAESENIMLKEQYRQGQSFNQVDLTQYRICINDGNTEVIVNTNLGFGYTCQFQSVRPEDRRWIAKLQIQSGFFESTGIPGQTSFYDSTTLFSQPDQNSMLLSYLVGDELEVEFGELGKVYDLKFSEAFIKNLDGYYRSNHVNLNKEVLKTMAIATFKSILSKQSDSPETGVYPNKPLAVGDTWQREIISEKNGLKLKLEARYTLKQRQDGISYVKIDSQFVSAQSGAETAYQIHNFTGGMTGIVEVAEDSGWLRAYDIRFKFEGAIEMKLLKKNEYFEKNASKPVASQKAGSSTIKLEGALTRKPLDIENR